MITGQGNLSLKKQDIGSQKIAASGQKRVVFSTKLTAGQTGFSLTSLTVPPEFSSIGFVNPSASDLANLNLLFNRSNLLLVSSARGVLMDYSSYNVASSTRIDFNGFTSLESEIITGTVQIMAQGSRVVDATPIIATGTLLAGSTDFNVGSAFELGKYAAQQIGAVIVYDSGVQQFRNTGNQASPADGNYYELSAGAGLGSVIRFNTAELYDRSILVLSNGLLAERPDGSMMAVVESVNGKLNNLALYVAALSGQSTTTVLGAPATNVDLKSFGDRVIVSEANIAALTVRDNAQESPTLQSDIIATKLGQKQYFSGTNYNGGISPTVTGVAGHVTQRGVFIPYQMQDGTWRMKFNIRCTFTSNASPSITINGITGITSAQAVNVSMYPGVAPNSPAMQSTSGAADGLIYTYLAAATDRIVCSGDIELASKPTWAY
jgi:hypothetical protein